MVEMSLMVRAHAQSQRSHHAQSQRSAPVEALLAGRKRTVVSSILVTFGHVGGGAAHMAGHLWNGKECVACIPVHVPSLSQAGMLADSQKQAAVEALHTRVYPTAWAPARQAGFRAVHWEELTNVLLVSDRTTDLQAENPTPKKSLEDKSSVKCADVHCLVLAGTRPSPKSAV